MVLSLPSEAKQSFVRSMENKVSNVVISGLELLVKGEVISHP